ncbi:MAG: DEAD/DEAH box helicase [Bdellovibrionota bacterium]|nr:DEAD/DEAH box helicase [Bdellovibrionota bacterium]
MCGVKQLNLLIAPPGWGKTYRLLEWIKSSEGEFVFVFPLRALCEEVYLSALKKKISCLCLRNFKDQKSIPTLKPKLLITTPELARSLDLGDRIILLDEFHLFFYWGESFRESMLEFIEEHLSTAPRVILLSATIGEEVLQKTKELFGEVYEQMRIWDFGNQNLKNLPRRIVYHRSKQSVLKLLELSEAGTGLVFCQYRDEVRELVSYLRSRGKKVLGCVGGEAYEFSIKLYEEEEWDIIVATTVVSHGVNLPVIKRVYFTYVVENLDFYLQMVGRAGRDGSSYDLHTRSFLYFKPKEFLKGVLYGLGKRLSHKWQSLLYCLYES